MIAATLGVEPDQALVLIAKLSAAVSYVDDAARALPSVRLRRSNDELKRGLLVVEKVFHQGGGLCGAASELGAMLEASKGLLVRDLELSLLVLRKRELEHFLRCIETFGNPATLLAGCAFQGISNANLVPRGTHWAPEVLYYVFTTGAMCTLIHVSVRGTMLSILGPTVALRGRNAEAMHRSVLEMERLFLGMWGRFAFGAVCWAIATMLFIYIHAPFILSICMATYILAFCVGIWCDFLGIARRFSVDPGMLERAEYSGEEVRRLALKRSGTRTALWSRSSANGTHVPARGLIEAIEVSGSVPSRAPPGWLSAGKRTLTRTFTSRTLRSPPVGGSLSHTLHTHPSSRTVVSAATIDAPLQGAEQPMPPKRPVLDAAFLAHGSVPCCSPPAVEASRSRDRAHDVAQSSQRTSRDGADDSRRDARSMGASLALDLTRHELGIAPQARAARSRGVNYGEHITQAEPRVVDVVVTVRHGARLRWRVPAELSVAELLKQAEIVFDQPLRALRDVNGHEIAKPRATPVSSHLHALDEEQSLAFFQAVPTATQSPFTMVQTLWDDYLHGG
jgi:hypothetical protein